VNEQGFSDFDDLTWIGFFVPAGTPSAVVARLNAELSRAFDAPDTRERLAQQGLEWKRNTPPEFATFLRSEMVKWARAVKESGAKAD